MHEKGRRKVKKLSEDTFVLEDTYEADNGEKPTKKTKVVRVYPKDLFWTNTRISSPGKYSQFIYRITPEGDNKSRLDFIGLQLEDQSMTDKQVRELARKMAKEDSLAWKYLARAMEKEL
jgi:hypothetical protein